MQQEGKHRWLRAPSPAMIVALIALVFAMSGTAVAASKLISGDKIIKIGSLSGNRLRNSTVTGTQINVAKLGKVPSAAQADTATSATHATSADTATNANHATSADTATNATHATSADSATHATSADTATSATNATHATSADTATSAAPSGAAGGDLSGNYPNPSIASGAVGTGKLAALPGARVYYLSASIPNGNWTTLSFTSPDFNVGGLYSANQPNRLTAPVAGKYLMTLIVAWDGSATGLRSLDLITGGTTVAIDTLPGMNDTSQNNFRGGHQELVTECQLSAGASVQAQVFQNSTGSLSVNAQTGTGFTMQWIAP